MRRLVIACSIVIGASLLSFPALAQQKTAKACQEEWRANKAANQAKGITEKVYVEQCRAGAAATQPTTTPAPSQAAPKKAPAPTAPQQSPGTQTKTVAPPPSAGQSAVVPSGANQFSTEAQAKARCSTGTVVWVNLESKIYHFAGNRNYGNTKSGAYMCETDATSQGMRAAKNEKHP